MHSFLDFDKLDELEKKAPGGSDGHKAVEEEPKKKTSKYWYEDGYEGPDASPSPAPTDSVAESEDSGEDEAPPPINDECFKLPQRQQPQPAGSAWLDFIQPKEPEEVSFWPGLEVKVIGLRDAFYLNDLKGICERWDQGKKRWVVKLENNEKKYLKEENLLSLEDEGYQEISASYQPAKQFLRWNKRTLRYEVRTGDEEDDFARDDEGVPLLALEDISAVIERIDDEDARGVELDPEAEYAVTLDYTEGSLLGISVYRRDRGLLIGRIKEGLFKEWNELNADCRVRAGDSIVEVNGLRDDVNVLAEEIGKHQLLDMKVLRSQKAIRQSDDELVDDDERDDSLEELIPGIQSSSSKQARAWSNPFKATEDNQELWSSVKEVMTLEDDPNPEMHRKPETHDDYLKQKLEQQAQMIADIFSGRSEWTEPRQREPGWQETFERNRKARPVPHGPQNILPAWDQSAMFGSFPWESGASSSSSHSSGYHPTRSSLTAHAEEAESEESRPRYAEVRKMEGTVREGAEPQDAVAVKMKPASFLPTLGHAPMPTTSVIDMRCPVLPKAQQAPPAPSRSSASSGRQGAFSKLQAKTVPSMDELLAALDEEEETGVPSARMFD
eukprot:gnl/TRDRNA2_/TRDRNA2_193532_c0_seq1.p1 gnl/TRDRNA2_/TRDRNA2_193532_c0~~gnl/TRDRNA2_/TRDRNA2_193532_c0_seq1.p1  ORF type:complete len:612 (+),score=142.82 gnl/TRDRNA2_/TRDRNA2_193532_c0_seq1:131-1966(+)